MPHHDVDPSIPPSDAQTEATPVSIQQIQEDDFRKITDMWLSGNQILNQQNPPRPPQGAGPPPQQLGVKPLSPQPRSASPVKPDLRPPSPQRQAVSPVQQDAKPASPPRRSVSPVKAAPPPPPVTSDNYTHNDQGNTSLPSYSVESRAYTANGAEGVSTESN